MQNEEIEHLKQRSLEPTNDNMEDEFDIGGLDNYLSPQQTDLSLKSSLPAQLLNANMDTLLAVLNNTQTKLSNVPPDESQNQEAHLLSKEDS